MAGGDQLAGGSMKRCIPASAVTLAVVLAASPLLADVKTREKTTFALEGVMGGLVRMFGGSAARDGVTSTVAVKGTRKSQMNDTTGRIVDLSEEKVYTVDVKKKEYRVTTFAELRAEYEKAKADAEKRAAEAKPEEKAELEQAGKELEFDVKVDETGQRRTIAGQNTREVVLTIAGREKGKTLEQSGGFVLTSAMWLGPKIDALDELHQFELRFIKAVYGESFAADMQQMAGLMALYPSFKEMASRMQSEGGKLNGTPLASAVTFETVRSEEQMKAAQSNQPSGASGGIGGMLGRRIMGGRNQPQPRSKVLTTTSETLSIDTSVSDADVAIPAGFKEKK
jgi:hypothetical protein